MQPEQGIKSSHQGIEQPHQGIPLGLECHLRLGSWIEESPDNVTQDCFTYIISWRIGRSVDLGRAGDECTAAPATTTPEERRIDYAHDRLPELKRAYLGSCRVPIVGKGGPRSGFRKRPVSIKV
jgi:hypothetical protein